MKFKLTLSNFEFLTLKINDNDTMEFHYLSNFVNDRLGVTAKIVKLQTITLENRSRLTA